MKKTLSIFLVAEVIILIFCFFANDMKANYNTGFSVGLLSLIIGFLMLLVAVILLIAKQKDNGMATLAAAGLVLLAGVVTCSFFPFTLG